MAMRPLLFTFSILIFCYSTAQEVDSLAMDSLTVNEPVKVNSTEVISENNLSGEDTLTIERRFLIIGPYFDLGKIVTIPLDFETKYEGGIELRFSERFSFYAEAGSVTTSPDDAYTNGVYESSGTYYRVGAGFVGPFDPEHNIGISFRYASSTFSESGRLFFESPSGIQEVPDRRIERSGLSAKWWEIILYSDKKLFKNSDLLWLGLNIRWRILQSYDSQNTPDVYAIPGYGRSFDTTIPAINFFLKAKF